MKKFYSLRLRHHSENIPVHVAENLLIYESELVNWLSDNQALKFKYVERRKRLDLYADEKYLTLGRLKFPGMFGNKDKIGFMELYISRQIKKRMQLSKGSS